MFLDVTKFSGKPRVEAKYHRSNSMKASAGSRGESLAIAREPVAMYGGGRFQTARSVDRVHGDDRHPATPVSVVRST